MMTLLYGEPSSFIYTQVRHYLCKYLWMILETLRMMQISLQVQLLVVLGNCQEKLIIIQTSGAGTHRMFSQIFWHSALHLVWIHLISHQQTLILLETQTRHYNYGLREVILKNIKIYKMMKLFLSTLVWFKLGSY